MSKILTHKIKNYGIIDDSRKQTITLNSIELKIAELLGKEKSKIGRSQVKFVEDTWEKHYLAYCGEMAFCKLMNINHSPIIDPTMNWTNDKGDAKWGDLKVDVKHSIYDKATLPVQSYAKDADIDLYVLMTGNAPTFKYQGAIEKDKLINDKYLGSNGIRGFENAYCAMSYELDYFWWKQIPS